jgi:hypothetical protein
MRSRLLGVLTIHQLNVGVKQCANLFRRGMAAVTIVTTSRPVKQTNSRYLPAIAIWTESKHLEVGHVSPAS